MNKYYPELIPTKSYHIFNHASANGSLFTSEENFYFFLNKFSYYINPVCETYSWCLMPNHFHFLVGIKSITNIISYLRQTDKDEVAKSVLIQKIISLSTPEKEKECTKVIISFISKSFSNLFSCYTQAFNKQQNRFGTLFSNKFKRIEIADDEQFKRTVHYIHNNPVHHGFVKHPEEWKFSSWHSIISLKPTKLKREMVIRKFESIENFKKYHSTKMSAKMVLEMDY